MRLLLIEDNADGLLDLALRAQVLGHDVKYHLAAFDPRKCPVGRGLVTRVNDWREHMRWADLVVCANTKWLRDLDRWRAAGVPIIGGGETVANLELNRLAGQAMFKRHSVPVPPFRQFSRLDDGIAYVAKQGCGFAVKPCGDVADKSLSFVGKTAEEMIWRLESWKREGKVFPQGFILQDRVEGIEFAVGAWVTKDGFAEGFEENFEEKKLMAGGLGPNCGEAGTIMRLVKRSKLAATVLSPFEDWLVASGYRGNVDVNCIVDEDGIAWPLEWTCRLGWPAFNIELALHEADPVEFLAGVAAGKAPKTRRLDEVAVGVVVALPPYPYGHERPEEVCGVPIWGKITGHMHFCMAQMGTAPAVDGGKIEKHDHPVTAGSYVCVVTGTGETVQAAKRAAYRHLEPLSIPASPFWRPDIGERLAKGLPTLHSQGYATGLEYS